MRIGFFSDNYLPMRNSGVVVSLMRFGKELSKQGHDIHLYAPRTTVEKHCGMTVHSCDAVTFNPYPELRLGYPINMNPPDFDVVHAHSPFTLGWYAVKTGIKQNIPKIITYHTVFEESVAYLFSGAEKHMKQIVLNYLNYHHKHYDHLIAPSQCMKEQVKHLKIPTTIVPTGIDFSETKIIKNAKQKLGLGDKRVYLCLARIATEKSIDVVIKAANKFLDDDSVLLVVGRGPKETVDNLKAVAKHKNIIFTGFVSEEDIDTYYSAADFFITASTSETQGLTTIEAMAHTVPVIGANAMATPEYVFNEINGYLFKPRDINALTDLVKKVQVPEKEMKKQALKTAKQYTMKKCGKLLLEVYETAIEDYSNKTF